MSRVILRKASYDYLPLKRHFFEIMDSIGGSLIQRKSRVLIKPNLLAPASPDKAMLTHPLVVRAAVEYVLERGAFPQISDSPAMGSFEKVLRESGIKEELKDLDVECREFRTSEMVDLGEPFHSTEIASEALKADIIINLPKCKTHTQMLLTLGVKNLFGCIVGLRKPEWHLRTGVDRVMFARLLVLICKRLKPSFTVLDAILAMEGQGPGKSGTPRTVGVLMGSDNAIALDMAACTMLRIEPERLLTNRVAQEMGLVDGMPEINGDVPEIAGFRLPDISPVVFGPRPLHGMMRKHLVQRPVSDNTLCKLCGECWKYCPAQAIGHDKKRLRFDYDACIRCYCCIEVCPHGALSTQETLAGRMVRKIVRRSS